jgi:GMP synthase (glutamine-hydrolysing)
MPIIVFQHADSERPGRLGLTLRDRAFRLDVRRPDRGDPFPVDYDGVEGVISLGGPQSLCAGRPEPWLSREAEYLRGAHERGLPVVGVCFGAQLLAAALGGEVARMEGGPEAGFAEVSILPAGQTDTILSGIAWASAQFHLHEDEVKTPPAGAVVLASSARCRVQAFRVGMRSYGFQYHPECDREMVLALSAENRTMLGRASLTVEEVARQCERHYERYARLGERLSLNIATYLIPKVATLVG